MSFNMAPLIGVPHRASCSGGIGYPRRDARRDAPGLLVRGGPRGGRGLAEFLALLPA